LNHPPATLTDLRALARGMSCRLRIPGYCDRDPEKTVLCHIKRGWCGSIKPSDLVAVYGCMSCHDVIDGRRQTEYNRPEIDAMILRALCEQLNWYVTSGIVAW
jgi:hypothetical protein